MVVVGSNILLLLCVLYCAVFVTVKSEKILFPVTCDEGINDVDRAKIYFLPNPSLPVDKAYSVYVVNGDCYKCAWRFLGNFSSPDLQCYSMWTPFSWTISLVDSTNSNDLITLQEQDYLFGDGGEYHFNTDGSTLAITETKTPVNSLEPLWALLGVLTGLALLSYVIPYAWSKYKEAHREDIYFASAGTTNKPFDHEGNLESGQADPLLAGDGPVSTNVSPGATISSQKAAAPNTTNTIAAPTTSSKKKRLQSLDTFRGIALLLMIFVNYGGGGYWFFEHASWNGLTVADLVFPWFMWIMGVSMALNFVNVLPPRPSTHPLHATMTIEFLFDFFSSQEEYFVKYRDAWQKMIIRSIKLFMLGMFLANGYEYTTWRVPGVLQYFACSYFMTAVSILLFYPTTQHELKTIQGKELQTPETSNHAMNLHASGNNASNTVNQSNNTFQIAENNNNTNAPSIQSQDSMILSLQNKGALTGAHSAASIPLRHQVYAHDNNLFDPIRLKLWFAGDIPWSRIYWAYRYEWMFQLGILIIFLSICFGVAAPGCPVGYNGAGGLSENSQYQFCTGGIHRYIDMKMFGYWFIYHHPTCLDVYQCRVYDPEGFLGVLSACTLTYLGLTAGRLFVHYTHHQDRVCLLLVGSFVTLLIAGILCGFSQNEGLIPVNKNLWSTSFILVTSGFGLVGLSICYILVDYYAVWTGAPFIYLGLNSILFYMSHQLLQDYMPFSYEVYHTNHKSLLLMHCVGVLSWVIIAYYFYKIKFFVKV